VSVEPSLRGSRRASPWRGVALACAAMLVLPLLAWLLAPGITPAPRPSPRREEIAAAAPPSAEPAPRAHRAAPVRPVATGSATPDADAPVLGVVLDPDGKPAARAFIGCDDRDQALATTTDDEGHFRLGPEASGCFVIAHPGSGVPSDRVQVFAGRDNVVRLNRGGGIDGEIVDERGAPVPSFLLGIESYQGAAKDSAPIGLVKSYDDPRGVFTWDSLAPGAYVLTASAEGRPPTRSRSIDVEVGRSSSHVRIVLARGGTLTGRILDGDTRRPLGGASVMFDALTMTGANSIRPARSDEAGAYTLEGAPSGLFSIRVSHPGYSSRTVSGLTTRGGATLQQDVELHALTDGGAREEFAGIGAVLAPSPGGVLIGSLVAGGPAEGAGLHVGDRIKRIDGVDAAGLPVSDCVQRLRGPEGSIVSMQVDREGRGVEISIVRRNFSR
jgi:hypothetical protein